MAEAAGFVLAAVPICVGVVEKYAEVARLLQRFREYGKEALYISQAINIHKSIYRNTIRILLSSIVSEDESRQMLSDSNHALWTDLKVDQEISDRLGDSREAFVDAVSAIKAKLAELERFGLECRSQVSQARSEPTTTGTSKKGLRTRIKFAFSKPEIESLLAGVDRLTQNVQSLIQQTESPHARKSEAHVSMATKKKIEEYNFVKGAAQNLYYALSHACKVSEHRTHLNLQTFHDSSSHVQFTIAMSHGDSKSTVVSVANERRFWLTVESVVSETRRPGEPPHVLEQLNQPYKRQRDEDTAPDQAMLAVRTFCKPIKARKGFHLAIPDSVVSQARMYPEHPEMLPNFCIQGNICAQLRKFSNKAQNDKSTCVGYLELRGCSKHLVYLKSATDIFTSSITCPMVALIDLLKQNYRTNLPCHGILQYDRVRIARQLAMAVLQFQATPWLDRPWNSKEVSILEIGDKPTATTDAGNDDNGLFLSYSVPNPAEILAPSFPFRNRTLIRNRLLFDLGVMMLELAFQKPLAELRSPEDIDQYENLNTEYFTADRVRREASAYLGPRYAEVARKCIQCDFGHDSNLYDTKLQESFYQDVILELEELEKRFRDFKLSI